MWFRRSKKFKQPSEMTKEDIYKRRVAESKLAKEISENYISISNAVTRICFNTGWTNKNLVKFWKKYYGGLQTFCFRGLDIVLSMYNFANEVDNYDDFYYKIFSRTVVEKIAKRHFYNDDVDKIMMNYDNSIKQINNINKGLEGKTYFEKANGCGFIAIFNNFENRDYDHFTFSLVFNRYKYTIEDFHRSWVRFDRFDENEFKGLYYGYCDELIFFTIQYGYSVLFMTYIMMLRKYNVFIQNEVVIWVLDQIKNDNKNKLDTFKEFYLVYSSLYRSAYEDEYSYDEIATFIIKEENIQKRDLFLACDYYKKDIEALKKDKDFEKLLSNIDQDEFLKKHSEKDPYIAQNRDYFYNELFDYLMVKCMNYMDDDDFLKNMFSKEAYIEKFFNKHS